MPAKIPSSPAVKRLTLAFAISIALHAIVAAFLRPSRISKPPREVVSLTHVITIAHRPKPTPTPKATPRPTPRPTSRPTPQPTVPPHPRIIAPAHLAVPTPGRASPHRTVVRPAQAAPRVRTTHHSTAPPVPVVMGGQGAGAGNGKAPTGDAGASGTGSGQGVSGEGSGAAAAQEPCGYVEFVDVGGLNKYDARTGGYSVDIRMIVHFPDGHTESVTLDYPWSYRDAASDPWSSENLKDPNLSVEFQWPPPAKAPLEPPLVQYVMRHTTPAGYTKLRDCPAGPAAAPAPEVTP